MDEKKNIAILKRADGSRVVLSISDDQFDFFTWLQQRNYIEDGASLMWATVVTPSV